MLSILMGKDFYQDHATFYDFQRIDREKFDKYFKFTIVRNPWDRAVSCYHYLMEGGNRKEEDLYLQTLFKSEYNTFEKFVLHYLDKDKIHEHLLFRPQYLYVFDVKGECQVDFIGKYENLENDIDYVLKKLGISSKLTHHNKSGRKQYQHYYQDRDLIEKIADLYRKDVEIFDYSYQELEL